ncbi:hypothetical protein [Ruminococcus sp.]|jgi:hypothetical protein|uniref:hypothetical protein n=1 Tax=Ruminococcus sp. TaxID=41978 RepID=UPI00307F0A94
MKVRVITSFNDKTEGFINRPNNEVFECSEQRAKELIDGGFATEVKSNATENKPNATEKPKRKTTKTA